ncbi:hypothetical protein DRD23_08690 [Salmonella enterica subsp. enterica serovar Enteritidis]|nr:hypothetical protein [Salmonella enterica subsp. enterica serovar Enteritidis]
MKREINDVIDPGSCCPGHDTFPADTYRSNRSKKARAEGIKKEHRHVRRVKKHRLRNTPSEIIAGSDLEGRILRFRNTSTTVDSGPLEGDSDS